MRPSRLLLIILSAWLAVALLLLIVRVGLSFFGMIDALTNVLPVLSVLWWAAGLLFLVLVAIDSTRRQFLSNISGERELPNSFSLGVNHPLQLNITHSGEVQLTLEVTEWAPREVEVIGLPLQLTLPANKSAQVGYHLRPLIRGNVHFGDMVLRVTSLWGLWQFKMRIATAGSAKIYPNFANISDFEALGADQQVNQMGVHLTQRRGQGMEFQQLREFRQGDVMRQVDWKATARQRKLISRQYQDERDQDIVVLLDCGRRMRTKDGDISHFDYALNAMLLLSYVALKKGDGFGFLSFGSAQRWVPPLKGAQSINTLLNRVYDLHSSTATSDLLEAGQQLLERHRKRSLVILVSNLREEDSDDLLATVKLLSKQHLVMVASLRENCLDNTLLKSVDSFDTALSYSAAVDFDTRRKRLLESAKARGAVMVDAAPEQMHIKLVNEYFALKRSGRI